MLGNLQSSFHFHSFPASASQKEGVMDLQQAVKNQASQLKHIPCKTS